MEKDLHVVPPRILAVCQVFRDRQDIPRRLADAVDDPMPVETGDPGLDGATRDAMQRLVRRFDEFASAMHQDAEGLVRSLQRYRAAERITIQDLDEVARSLAARPGGSRPAAV